MTDLKQRLDDLASIVTPNDDAVDRVRHQARRRQLRRKVATITVAGALAASGLVVAVTALSPSPQQPATSNLRQHVAELRDRAAQLAERVLEFERRTEAAARDYVLWHRRYVDALFAGAPQERVQRLKARAESAEAQRDRAIAALEAAKNDLEDVQARVGAALRALDRAPDAVEVPNVQGLPYHEARKVLENAGLGVLLLSPIHANSVVADQVQEPGTTIRKGARIEIVLVSGSGQTTTTIASGHDPDLGEWAVLVRSHPAGRPSLWFRSRGIKAGTVIERHPVHSIASLTGGTQVVVFGTVPATAATVRVEVAGGAEYSGSVVPLPNGESGLAAFWVRPFEASLSAEGTQIDPHATLVVEDADGNVLEHRVLPGN